MKTSLKDWPKLYQKIKRMRGMTVQEKLQSARALAASPDERWQMNMDTCKALGVWGKGLAGKRKLERMVVKGKGVGCPTWI